MKTVNFNEEELELLIALYEDELKEAGSYTEKVQHTLAKLKKQIDTVGGASQGTGNKRGRPPKIQSAELTPVVKRKRGRPPKIQSAEPELPAAPKKRGRKPRAIPEVLRPISQIKRGRKPKIQQNYSPLVTMIEDMTSPRKNRSPRINKFPDVKIKAKKTSVVELPTTGEVSPLDN
ncbi:MAG: hypothetical protein ABSD71_03860 [Bacteroidales bacterium]|jgi:hypothetical protein